MSSSQFPLILAGVEGYPVEDVKISNVFFQQVGGADAAMAALKPPENEAKYPDPNMFGALPASGLFIPHARNVELSHIEVQTLKPDARPACGCRMSTASTRPSSSCRRARLASCSTRSAASAPSAAAPCPTIASTRR